MSSRNADLGLRPLTARSVLLSALLGTNPPRLKAAKLVAVAELFGLSEGAARTALSRLSTAGDVTLENGRYRLNTRLLQRQRRQDQSRGELRKPWNGRWIIAVVDPFPRPPADRIALRRAMAELRLGEWREGVWMRPDNLGRRYAPVLRLQCTTWSADPADGLDGRGVVARLWDLVGWSSRAVALIEAFPESLDVAERFMLGAATLHHLLADPLLPDGLAPDDWPADQLRHHFTGFYHDLQAELAQFLR